MKKLMLLGGSRYLIPAIKAAKELGAYVITVDNIPNNIAHSYSDKYINESIIDKDAILKIATEENIDGILSFATDPGVVVAAYVAEKLNLPTNPLKSIIILQNKNLFRQFLMDNGFNTPAFTSYDNINDALNDKEYIELPVIVKPIDSAGSKGVKKVEYINQLEEAIKYAFNHSFSKKIIIEEFLSSDGYTSDTDSFSIDGELSFVSFNTQIFDSKAINPYTPSAYVWPSDIPEDVQEGLKSELQRLVTLLDLKTGIYNIETRYASNGKAYIMECAPRAGGNRLAEILKLSTGQDIISLSVKAALGYELDTKLQAPVYNGVWGEIILHSNEEGIFKSLFIDEKIKDNIVEVDLWAKPGDKVNTFTGANQTLGTIIFKCSSKKEWDDIYSNLDNVIKVELEKE